MGALNVHGVGTAVADPELRQVGSNNTPLTTVVLAFNRSFKKGDGFEKETTFLKTVVWGKRGEKFAEVVKKGFAVYVTGYLRQENWTDDDDNKHQRISVTVQDWQLIQKISNGSSDNTTQAPINEPVTVGTEDEAMPF